MPAIAAGVPIAFLDPATPWVAQVGGVVGGQHLRAAAIARVNLRYDDEKAGVVHDEEYEAILLPLTQVPDATRFAVVDYDDRDLVTTSPVGAVYGLVPSELKAKTYWTALQKALVDNLVRNKSTSVFYNADLKAYSRLGETQADFVKRCETLSGDAADKDLTALRSKYEAKLVAARSKASDAQINAQMLQQEYDSSYGLAATVTQTVLGSLLGGRTSRSSMQAQARKSSQANAKAGAAAQKAQLAAQTVNDLETQCQQDLLEITDAWKAKAGNVTEKQIPLEKSDVAVADFRLVWVPVG
jgi:hypothetical protein